MTDTVQLITAWASDLLAYSAHSGWPRHTTTEELVANFIEKYGEPTDLSFPSAGALPAGLVAAVLAGDAWQTDEGLGRGDEEGGEYGEDDDPTCPWCSKPLDIYPNSARVEGVGHPATVETQCGNCGEKVTVCLYWTGEIDGYVSNGTCFYAWGEEIPDGAAQAST